MTENCGAAFVPAKRELAEAAAWIGDEIVKKQNAADREYDVPELIRLNLKVWWLMILFALAGAAFLGGYKYLSNRSYVSEKNYEEVYRVTASLYVREYNDEAAAVRIGTLIKTADSRSAWQRFLERTGYDLEYVGYQQMFDLLEGESSDIVTVYVGYPAEYGGFSIPDEEAALVFADDVIAAIDETMQEIVGEACFDILDEPYVAEPTRRQLAYAPSAEEFREEILKAATAGLVFGVIVEVTLYTGFLLLRGKGVREPEKEG